MSENKERALGQYRELLFRLEEKFAEIRAAYPSEFKCGLGCHSCCKPGLTVSPLETLAIGNFLKERPELVAEIESMQNENPHRGKRCHFLSKEGGCRIYEARPLVCRSHGAPLQLRPLEKTADENLRIRDVCPLNFTGQNVTTLPPQAVLNLDTLNALLALLNKLAFPGEESRTPLEIKALLAEPSPEKN